MAGRRDGYSSSPLLHYSFKLELHCSKYMTVNGLFKTFGESLLSASGPLGRVTLISSRFRVTHSGNLVKRAVRRRGGSKVENFSSVTL